jgi:hypothetical protein
MTFTQNNEIIFIDEEYIINKTIIKKCKYCLDEPLKAGSMCFTCDPRIKY